MADYQGRPARYSWKEFLSEWSREIIASRQFAEFLTRRGGEHPDTYTPDVLASGWLGYPGATDEQIAAAEARLGISLPSDYREFLQVTNGWLWTNSFIERIWPVEEIQWLASSDPDIIADWSISWDWSQEEYGREDAEDGAVHEQKCLPATLRISDIEYAGTAMLLLNPEVIRSSGEWEAWFFAHWVPGAEVYPSFWELMQNMHSTFLLLEKQPG
jgi:hypothetical protein